MDTVLKLRELRAHAGMTQEDVARRCRIGVKTISSFESGTRIDCMKLSQLEAILAVYKITPAQFFSRSIEHDLAPWASADDTDAEAIIRRLEALPPLVRGALAGRIAGMLDAAETILPRATSESRSATDHAQLH